MIIVGKQRRGTLKRLLSGCAAERIARHAPCPVLLVGQEQGETIHADYPRHRMGGNHGVPDVT